jgi:WD40 repeat protein
VTSVAFSPDGTRLAATTGLLPTSDTELQLANQAPVQTQIWALAAARRLATVSGGDPEWSPDGGYLASTGQDGTVRVWEADSDQLVSQLKSAVPIIGPAFFAPESRNYTTGHDQLSYIVTGSDSGSGAVWDAASGVQVAELSGDAGLVTAAGFAPDGREVLTYSSDGTARIWNTGVISATPSAASAAYEAAATYGSNTDARLLTDSGGVAEDPRNPLRAIALGSNPPSSLGPPNAMVVLDARTGAPVATLPPGPYYFGVAFDASGRVMLVERSAPDSTKMLAAQLRLAHGGQLLHTLSGAGSLATSAAISADGRLVATIDGDDRIAVWDVQSGRRLALFEGHAGRHTQFGLARVVFKFSPDGSLILSSDDSGLTFVWNARSGRVLNRVQGVPEPPGTAYSGWGGAISPDDKLFVTAADWDTAATIFRVGQPQPLLTLPAGLFGIDDATFNDDGSLLATISGQSVSLWDTSEQSPVLTIPGDFGSRVEFAPDGTSLITNGFGPQPYETLPCDVCGGFGQLLALAAARTTRGFTPAERTLYLGG